jgi:hypothetical protein
MFRKRCSAPTGRRAAWNAPPEGRWRKHKAPLPENLSDDGAVRARPALGALADLELDALVLFQCAETGSLDLRVVHKHVTVSLVGGDEAEALFRVEPLHSSLCHYCIPSHITDCDERMSPVAAGSDRHSE